MVLEGTGSKGLKKTILEPLLSHIKSVVLTETGTFFQYLSLLRRPCTFSNLEWKLILHYFLHI